MSLQSLHSLEHLLALGYNFCCNPLSPRRRMTTRIWMGAIISFTLSTTSFMLGCVCTDQWEITTYDYRLLNDTISNNSIDWRSYTNDHCTFTHTRPYANGLLLVTSSKRRLISADSVNQSMDIYNRSINLPPMGNDQPSPMACQGRIDHQNISLAFRQFGSAFRLCLDVDDRLWPNISRLCSPMDIDKCVYYSPTTVKKPFCCKRCLYSADEVQELDENGNTTFEPIFTVIGFLIVCLVVLCVCHILALIAVWKRLVPVVMFTGILFLVSGTFMAFCLAAHQYKVSIMNSRGRSLPHITYEMGVSSRTEMGWSIDSGWMGFVFSILTGILWIRFSFHLASETTYNKIRPTLTLVNNRSGAPPSLNRAISVATGSVPGTQNTDGPLVPKTVRWAVSPGNGNNDGSEPNSRPGSGSQLLQGDQLNNTGYGSRANGTPASANSQQKDHVKLPMMVEEAV